MKKLDEYLKYIKKKREEKILVIENGEKGYRKINKKKLDILLDIKIGELEISKEIQSLKKDDLLVSYDLNSLYPGAQIDINTIWPKTETTYPFKKYI